MEQDFVKTHSRFYKALNRFIDSVYVGCLNRPTWNNFVIKQKKYGSFFSILIWYVESKYKIHVTLIFFASPSPIRIDMLIYEKFIMCIVFLPTVIHTLDIWSVDNPAETLPTPFLYPDNTSI